MWATILQKQTITYVCEITNLKEVVTDAGLVYRMILLYKQDQDSSCQNLAGGPGVGIRNGRGRGNFQCRSLGGLVQWLGGFNGQPPPPPGNYSPEQDQ
jgi:hypothetical protein